MSPRDDSSAPQARCVCPPGTSPRACAAIRYGVDRTYDGSEDECECGCHEGWDEWDDEDFVIDNRRGDSQ